jgi:hypothetical protein
MRDQERNREPNKSAPFIDRSSDWLSLSVESNRASGIENGAIPLMGYSVKFYDGKGMVIRCLIARDR